MSLLDLAAARVLAALIEPTSQARRSIFGPVAACAPSFIEA
jgi:hypothetical protein